MLHSGQHVVPGVCKALTQSACQPSCCSSLTGRVHPLLAVQRIKIGLNSKMPSRFPPVVFYSPKVGLVCSSATALPTVPLQLCL